jgi:ATP-dependent DNA ligase
MGLGAIGVARTPPTGIAASVVQRGADSVMRIKPLPAGFVIPAQPVKASKPPSGADWVHEIKHDGYRIIVRREGPTVRLYSRNANDWTARLSAIATAARRIKAKSFTIDGEAVQQWQEPVVGDLEFFLLALRLHPRPPSLP